MDEEVPAAEKRERKRCDERRDALRDALIVLAEQRHRLVAAAPSRSPAPGAPPSAWDDFARAVAEMRKWVDPGHDSTKRDRAVTIARLIASHERRSGRPGAALQALRKEMGRAGCTAVKGLTSDFRALCRERGWAHLDQYWADREAKLFPSA